MKEKQKENDQKLAFPLFILYFCFIFSGASSLIFEVAWSKALSLFLGNTIYSISTVIGSYMAGLGIGALAAGMFASRLKYPMRVYGWIEGMIGIFGFLSPYLFKLLPPLFSFLFFLQDLSFSTFLAIRFLIIFFILLIPTTAMGTTLPILVSALTDKHPFFCSNVSKLYGSNTIGAVLGTLFSGFLLLPYGGLFRTIMIASSLHLSILAIIYMSPPLFLWRTSSRFPWKKIRAKAGATSAQISKKKAFLRSVPMILPLFTLSGFLALLYQVGWTKVLLLIMGSSVYSLTIILSTYLWGIALGSLLVAKFADRIKKPFLVFGILEVLLGMAALSGTFAFYSLPQILASIIQKSQFKIKWIVLGEFPLSGLIIFLPSLIMGLLFPVATSVYRMNETSSARNVGRIYSFNTFGALFGSIITGFFFIPHIGILKTLLMASALNITIGIIAFFLSEISLRLKITFSILALTSTLFFFILNPSWDINRMNRGLTQMIRDIKKGDPTGGIQKKGQILYYKEGKNATVAVSYVGDDIYLKIGGKVDASAVADATTQVLCAQIPFLYADQPSDVCVIGLGSGTTTHSVLTHPVRSVETIEIEEAVLESSKYFSIVNKGFRSDPRSKIIIDDARNYLSYVPKKYDVIISEPSNPWIAGVNNLFTAEFYDIIYEKLKDGGVFSQWVQSYELSIKSYATLLRTIHSRFPHGYFYYFPKGGDSLFIAKKGQWNMTFHKMATFFENRRVKEDLSRINIDDPFDLASYYISPLSAIVKSLGQGPLNTDDNSYIEYQAPFELLHQNKKGFRIAVDSRCLDEMTKAFFTDLKEKQALLGMGLAFLKKNDETRMDFVLARMKKSHYEEEMAQLIKEIRKKEQNKERERMAYELFEKAKKSLQKGQMDMAAHFAHQAISLRSDLDDLIYRVALLFLQMNKVKEAEPLFKRIIERKPLAYTYLSYLHLGRLYRDEGKLKKGLESYQKAIDDYPFLAEAYIQISEAYLSIGEEAEARKNLNRALELDPSNERALDLLEDL